ncbi:hypothetical protein [Flavobacterium sp.]|uniref:hypothetical protein n=1 Tax=Flavobacterium sp. TaxID=239 RepID=UPI00262DE2F9|nr:hypothetical protein [Flavobacterium sp.]
MKTIFLCLFGLLSLTLFSQNVPVKTQKSILFEDDYKKSILVLGEKTLENEIVIVRSYKASAISPLNGYYIEKYDANLKLIKEFELKMKHPLSEKNNLVLGVFYANKKVNIIEIYFDLKGKTYICRANIVDDNFNLTKKELFRISKEKMKELGSFNLQQKFFEAANKNLPDVNSGNFNTSTDRVLTFAFFGNSTKPRVYNSDISLVVNENRTAYSIVLDYKNPEQEGFLLYLFDAESDQIFFKEELIQSKEKNYVLQNFQVSEDGKSVYILAKNYNNKVKKLKYSFELSQISATETKIKTIEIEDKFIKSLKLNFHNNSIYCIGFYSEKSYEDNDGLSFFKFNKQNLESEKVKFSPFTKQFIEDKFGKETDKDIKDLKIKTVLFENDDILLNAEEEFEVNNSSTIPTNNSVTGNTNYHFNDIVSVKLNTDGELIWSRNINKKQSYTYSDDSYISYFSTIKNGISYFFINASEKIKELKNERVEFKDVNPNKANLYLLTIDSTSNFSYQLLLDDESSEVTYIVSKGIFINDSCYFLGRKGKKKQLLKVTL